MSRRPRYCDVALLVIGVLCIVLGVVILAIWPTVYESVVYSVIKLMGDPETNSYAFSTTIFSRPPMNNQMKFYFFNVTNQDEISYEGAAPRVVQIGPYNFWETEEKRYLKYNDDKTKIFYENYKKWIYGKEISCEDCDYHDPVTVPNAANNIISSAFDNPKIHISKVGRLIFSIALILLGELPFNTPRMGDLLFDGYNDPFLSVGHSHILDVINVVFNRGKNIIPIPYPDIHTLALFKGYNNSRDENYWVGTGKEDIYDFGKIESWGGQKLLPEEWWTTKQARMINGSDTGTLAHPHLDEDTVLPMFHSFFCRSFNARFAQKVEVKGIPSYRYSVKADEWDTTLEKNKGFRYPNHEKVRYYPDWPPCPNYNTSNCIARPDEPIDCNAAENLCDDCCFHGFSSGTWITPPGMFPLACYSGHLKVAPINLMISAPHFLYSPKEIISAVKGMEPDPALHTPMLYDYESYSGAITHLNYRAQISMPVYKSKDVAINEHLSNSILPMLWIGADAYLSDFVYGYYNLGFVSAPKIELGISISLIILGCILEVVLAIRMCRRKQKTTVLL